MLYENYEEDFRNPGCAVRCLRSNSGSVLFDNDGAARIAAGEPSHLDSDRRFILRRVVVWSVQASRLTSIPGYGLGKVREMNRFEVLRVAQKVQPWIVTVLALTVAALTLFKEEIVEMLK